MSDSLSIADRVEALIDGLTPMHHRTAAVMPVSFEVRTDVLRAAVTEALVAHSAQLDTDFADSMLRLAAERDAALAERNDARAEVVRLCATPIPDPPQTAAPAPADVPTPETA